MKRILALLLALVMLLCLTACGGGENGTPTGENTGVAVSTNDPINGTQSTTESTIDGDTTGATEPPATTAPTTEPAPDTTTQKSTEPKPTTPTPTDPKPTESTPTQPKPTEPQVQDWRTAYLDFLESVKDYHSAFALVYIDEDDIPEIYLNGDDEATGDAICTYKNGRVIEQRLRRTWGGSYVPNAGLIKNTNGNMGYYTTDIYRLTDSGFAVLWSGLEVQETVPPLDENEYVTFASTFYIGDQTVSEEEYYAAIKTVFDISQAVQLHENTVSFNAIQRLILGKQ